MANPTYGPKVYMQQGGDIQVVAAGGKIQFEGQTAVVQQTNINTAVAVNGLAGAITTVSQTIAGNTFQDFVVNNSFVEATDVIVPCISSYGGTGDIDVAVKAVAAGSFTLRLRNTSASAGSGTVGINFLVLKTKV